MAEEPVDIQLKIDGDPVKRLHGAPASYGSSHKAIGDPLLGAMAKQVGPTKKSFLELVDCTLDQAGYERTAFPTTSIPAPVA